MPWILDTGRAALSKSANKENDMSPPGEHGIKLTEARSHKWGGPTRTYSLVGGINCGPSVNRGNRRGRVVAHDLIETIETKNLSGSRPLRSPGRR